MTRIVALLVALLLTASTAGADWLLCGGSARSAGASHACCDEMEMRVSAQQASSCCTISEQTRERGPIEARIVSATAAIIAADRVSFAEAAALPARPVAVSTAPASPSVPIYLQQRSLLI